jgi:hypothetical protein
MATQKTHRVAICRGHFWTTVGGRAALLSPVRLLSAAARERMHQGLLAVMVTAGLLSVPAPHEAAAAPVTIAAPQILATLASGSIERIYYYRGGYYPYSYRGMYFRHRYCRYGRYHYY